MDKATKTKVLERFFSQVRGHGMYIDTIAKKNGISENDVKRILDEYYSGLDNVFDEYWAISHRNSHANKQKTNFIDWIIKNDRKVC